jgi:hypothetical protein
MAMASIFSLLAGYKYLREQCPQCPIFESVESSMYYHDLIITGHHIAPLHLRPGKLLWY